jgi:hypothetical protein
MKRPRRPLTIACTVLSLAFMAGCGSENTSSQSSPSRMPTSALGATGKPKESTAPAPREESKSSLQTVQAFADFATGKANRVPWSTETTLYFNGAEVARFDPARAGRRDSWSGCPHGSATFEGRDCPVLPLTVVRDANRGTRSTSIEDEAPAVVGCSRVRKSADVVGKAAGWIRPDQDRDCFGDFAVAVYLDDAGDVSAVNVVLSGP